mgnify:CR=1 FL=1
MSTSAKVTARQRIENLLDDNSFVEIGAYVKARNTDFNIQAKDTPSDGVITGYGVINGGLVYVYSQDASVLGGSVGEMHAKKIASLYDMAMKTGSPVIGLIDSTGLRLQESVDGCPDLSRPTCRKGTRDSACRCVHLLQRCAARRCSSGDLQC